MSSAAVGGEGYAPRGLFESAATYVQETTSAAAHEPASPSKSTGGAAAAVSASSGARRRPGRHMTREAEIRHLAEEIGEGDVHAARILDGVNDSKRVEVKLEYYRERPRRVVPLIEQSYMKMHSSGKQLVYVEKIRTARGRAARRSPRSRSNSPSSPASPKSLSSRPPAAEKDPERDPPNQDQPQGKEDNACDDATTLVAVASPKARRLRAGHIGALPEERQAHLEMVVQRGRMMAMERRKEALLKLLFKDDRKEICLRAETWLTHIAVASFALVSQDLLKQFKENTVLG